MAPPIKTLIALANLGKGLVQNASTKLIDLFVSTDANNGLKFGSDNGLYTALVTPANLLSTDSGQALGLGSDNKLFYAGGSGSSSSTPNYNTPITNNSTTVIS